MELGNHSYACHTAADAARVWSALTDPEQTVVFLYGLALVSTWTEQAPLEALHDNGFALRGHVLCSRPGARLSYALSAGPGDPPSYVTWLIRPVSSGCVVTLQIDELADHDDGEEAEEVWLPVLARLQHLLTVPPGDG